MFGGRPNVGGCQLMGNLPNTGAQDVCKIGGYSQVAEEKIDMKLGDSLAKINSSKQ